MKKLKTTTALLLGLAVSQSYGQSEIVPSGGEGLGTGGTTSFTIGQIAYQTTDTQSDYVAEGVQQPYEIFTVLDIGGSDLISLSFSAYPNPTTDYLILKFDEAQDVLNKTLTFSLYNATGQQLNHNKLSDISTKIEMKHLPKGIYFLKIVNKDIAIKTFKIIKK